MGCPCNCPTETCLNFPVNNTTGTSQFDPCYEIDLCSDGCEETLSSKCVIYKGPNLTCNGLSHIAPNTNTQTIIQSLYSMICGLKTQINNLQDQINNCCESVSGIQFSSLDAIGCTRGVTGDIGVIGLSYPFASGESITVTYRETTLVLNTDYTLSMSGELVVVSVNYDTNNAGALVITGTNSLGSNSATYNIECPCVLNVDSATSICVGGQNEITFTLLYSNLGTGDIFVDYGEGQITFPQTESPQTITFNLPGGSDTVVPVAYGAVGNESCANSYDVEVSNCCYMAAVQTNAICKDGLTANYTLDLTWLHAVSESGTITAAITGSGSYTNVKTIAYNTFDGSVPVEIVTPLSVTGVSVHFYFSDNSGCETSLELDYPICS